jgi:hypothetical protein
MLLHLPRTFTDIAGMFRNVSKYICLQIKHQFASSLLELVTNSFKHGS